MRRFLAGLILLALATTAVVVVTGISLVPPGIWIGPCLYDRTSALSYHPRVSSMGQLRFTAGALNGELCYGRPAARGRAIYGGLVPYGQVWRLGANEPTRLYLDRAASVGGITLPAGRYSLYVRPDSTAWTLFVTRSVLHWGNDISEAVRAREVGHADLPVTGLDHPVELFTVTSSSSADTTSLSFDWASTRFTIPIVPL
ncbi:MAG: DUF2911 domain-containing protein [Gemmatimonadota bacterium]